MKRTIQFKPLANVLVILLALVSFCVEAADAIPQQVVAREKVIFQVSDSVPENGIWPSTMQRTRKTPLEKIRWTSKSSLMVRESICSSLNPKWGQG